GSTRDERNIGRECTNTGEDLDMAIAETPNATETRTSNAKDFKDAMAAASARDQNRFETYLRDDVRFVNRMVGEVDKAGFRGIHIRRALCGTGSTRAFARRKACVGQAGAATSAVARSDRSARHPATTIQTARLTGANEGMELSGCEPSGSELQE